MAEKVRVNDDQKQPSKIHKAADLFAKIAAGLWALARFFKIVFGNG